MFNGNNDFIKSKLKTISNENNDIKRMKIDCSKAVLLTSKNNNNKQ